MTTRPIRGPPARRMRVNKPGMQGQARSRPMKLAAKRQFGPRIGRELIPRLDRFLRGQVPPGRPHESKTRWMERVIERAILALPECPDQVEIEMTG